MLNFGREQHGFYDASVTINGEEIETTPWHLFLTDEGWTEAEDLQEGDSIASLGGVYGIVDSVIIENTTQTMYDLTVEEVHTFAVGDGAWVVHNRCSEARERQAAQLSAIADDIYQNMKRQRRDGNIDITIGAVYLEDGSVGVVMAADESDINLYLGNFRNAVNRMDNVNILDVDIPSAEGLNHAEQVIYNFMGQPESLDIGISNPTGPCGRYCDPFFVDKDVAIGYPAQTGGANNNFLIYYRGLSSAFHGLFGRN